VEITLAWKQLSLHNVELQFYKDAFKIPSLYNTYVRQQCSVLRGVLGVQS